uniref:hypothetical protein n=1 Tax=Escherichia coli TaxID=562 RepID=UPI00311ADE4D
MSKGGEKSLQPMTMVIQLTFLVMLEQGKVPKDHIAGRNLYVSGGKENADFSTRDTISRKADVITLIVGSDSFNIGTQNTAPNRREWYSFWKSASATKEKNMDVYIGSRRITSFSLMEFQVFTRKLKMMDV